MFDINITKIAAMGYDSERQSHVITMWVKPAHSEMTIKRPYDVSESEYIAICGWLQLNMSHGYGPSKLKYSRVLFETCSFLLTGSFDDIDRLRRNTTTFIQQDWRQETDSKDPMEWSWETRDRSFGFVINKDGAMALFRTVRQLAQQSHTSSHEELANKLTEIAQSSLFPRVDYELQLRWRGGQDGIEGGYATIGRVDKNDICDLGKRLGAK